ncbi:hypothetical protein YC2023_099901 [Brassica napus]
MICPRLSVCLLDDRRLHDESLGVSWNKPSLSRWLTETKNHFTPLSGPELSSTKSKARSFIIELSC